MPEELNTDIPANHEQTDGEPIAPSQDELMAQLSNENDALRNQIEELQGQEQKQRDFAAELLSAEHENDELRRRHTELALGHAISMAAVKVGISQDAALAYRGQFHCELDEEGNNSVSPDPASFFSNLIDSDAMLRESQHRTSERRSSSAVINGAMSLNEVDPIVLIRSLDRDPGRKARFVRKYGTQAFVDLAEAARHGGYQR